MLVFVSSANSDVFVLFSLVNVSLFPVLSAAVFSFSSVAFPDLFSGFTCSSFEEQSGLNTVSLSTISSPFLEISPEAIAAAYEVVSDLIL